MLAVIRSRELHEGLKRFAARDLSCDGSVQGYWRFFGRVDAEEGFFFQAPVEGYDQDNCDFTG